MDSSNFTTARIIAKLYAPAIPVTGPGWLPAAASNSNSASCAERFGLGRHGPEVRFWKVGVRVADGIISEYRPSHEESVTNTALLKDPVHCGSCREKRSRRRIQLGSGISRSGVLCADHLWPQKLTPTHRVRKPPLASALPGDPQPGFARTARIFRCRRNVHLVPVRSCERYGILTCGSKMPQLPHRASSGRSWPRGCSVPPGAFRWLLCRQDPDRVVPGSAASRHPSGS
jgi:hypothetical protein